MYMLDDVIYAGEPVQDLKVENVRVVNDLCMLVRFSTGETRLFDASELLAMPAFAPLKNKKTFENFSIERGVLTWDSGAIDLAPETLYEKSHRYEAIA